MEDGLLARWTGVDEAIRTADFMVVRQALDALEDEGPESFYRCVVRSLCFHPDVLVRDDAIERLEEVGEEEDLYRLLLLTKDNDSLIRMTAAYALSEWKESPSRNRLMMLSRRDYDSLVRKAALQALFDQDPGDDRLRSFFEERLDIERSPLVRLSLYDLLVRLGERRYLPPLFELFDEDSEEDDYKIMRSIFGDRVRELKASAGVPIAEDEPLKLN